MLSDELLSLYRQEMVDLEEPYLVSDELFYTYLNEAQTLFCRLTEGIEDSRTPEVTALNIVPGTEWYPTHKAILKIRKATRGDTGRDVPLRNVEKLRSYGIRFHGVSDVLNCLVEGLEKHTLRAYPIPNETVTVNLSVFRLPLNKIDDDGQELEIDEQHHTYLLLWVKHRVYDIQDSEIFDKRKSDDLEERFRSYCATAKVEQERLRRSVGTVSYGGI